MKYKNQPKTKEAGIYNTLIEEMFFRATDDDDKIATYLRLVDAGRIGLATAYASKEVHKKFMKMIEKHE